MNVPASNKIPNTCIFTLIELVNEPKFENKETITIETIL